MTRGLMSLDRLTTLLLGIVLLAIGVLALLWSIGVSWIPETLSTPWLVTAITNRWLLAGLAILGLVLIWLGLRWLLAHVSTPAPTVVKLRGSTADGYSRAHLGSVGTCAAEELGVSADVTTTGSSVLEEDGRSFVQVTGTVDPTAEGAGLLEAGRAVLADIDQAFSETAVASRVLYNRPANKVTQSLRKSAPSKPRVQ